MAAMDTLNRRFGRDSVRAASQLVASGQSDTKSWSIKQVRRSPRYTTCWDKMPVCRLRSRPQRVHLQG